MLGNIVKIIGYAIVDLFVVTVVDRKSQERDLAEDTGYESYEA